MSDKVTVAVRDLSKTYYVGKDGSERSLFGLRGRTEVRALRKTTFTASSGECIGILGKNGAGKSTLLNLIAGSESPTTGTVKVSDQPTLLGISAALQSHLTGRVNVRLGLLAMGLQPVEAQQLSDSVLEWGGLEEAADRPMRTYSAGMKSRLKFSIATAVRREILLVDEALSAGDSTFAERAADRMNEFLNEAGTVFIVSHAAGTIEKYCTRVLWLHGGRIIADGDTESISKSYRIWSKNVSSGNLDEANHIIERRAEQYKPPRIIFDSEALEALDRDNRNL